MNDTSSSTSERPERLALDEKAIDAARQHTEDGAVTPNYGPWRQDVLDLLGSAMATAVTAALQYRRHHYMARGMASPAIADLFAAQSDKRLAAADELAERIVQLGGEPDLDPKSLTTQGQNGYDAADDLSSMIRADLSSARVAIEASRQMIRLIADKDPTTHRLLAGLLETQEDEADALSDLMDD